MAIKYFLVDLLCIFAPLLAIEVWQVRRSVTRDRPDWSFQILAISCLCSSIVCTFFNIPLSTGIDVNLAIVPLSLAFFVLPWTLGLAVVGLYVVLQTAIAMVMEMSVHFSWHTAWTVLEILPRQLPIVAAFAFMMCACSMSLRNQRPIVRGFGFVASLVCYCLINYVYNNVIHTMRDFNWNHFILIILAINLTFGLAVRLLIAGQKAHSARLDAIRMEKLQVISELAASVAHEIRNPITVVRGFTQLMLAHDPGRSRTVEFMQNMMQELDTAESIINDYLQLAKKQVDDIQMELDLSRVVSHTIEVLRPYAVNSHVGLSSSVADHINVYGHEDQISQAIMHLVKNAIESHEREGAVEVTLRQNGERVELKVADSGRGISPSELSKLGTPYYSTRSQGTGLGLTLTYKVIGEMNGRIRVRSRLGSGTVFTVSLPGSLHQEAATMRLSPVSRSLEQ